MLLAALSAALLAWPQANRLLFLFLHPLLQHLPAPLWRLISVFGDWPTVLALMLALCWREPRRLPALIVGGAAAIALAALLKAGFAVPRPPLVLPRGSVDLLDRLPGNGSFPSGHAMAAAALATFAWRGAGWGRAAAWLPLVGLVMLSRIAIGVHWPLDLAVGALLGWGTMRLALRFAWPGGWLRDTARTAAGVAGGRAGLAAGTARRVRRILAARGDCRRRVAGGSLALCPQRALRTHKKAARGPLFQTGR